MAISIIYITCPSKEEAETIAGQMVKERLAACANIFPISSMYWWEKTIQTDQEWVAILKTRNSLWQILQERVASIHPYEIPCIVRFKVDANPAYEVWIKKETRRGKEVI